MVPDHNISIFESNAWKFKGTWQILKGRQRSSTDIVPLSKYADTKGAELELTFEGTGVALIADWKKNGGQADVYLDGNKDRTVDSYYWWTGEEKGGGRYDIWHVFNLQPGPHTVRLVVTGEKKSESEGTAVNTREAVVFKTGVKKNETVKLSFEK